MVLVGVLVLVRSNADPCKDARHNPKGPECSTWSRFVTP